MPKNVRVQTVTSAQSWGVKGVQAPGPETRTRTLSFSRPPTLTWALAHTPLGGPGFTARQCRPRFLPQGSVSLRLKSARDFT